MSLLSFVFNSLFVDFRFQRILAQKQQNCPHTD